MDPGVLYDLAAAGYAQCRVAVIDNGATLLSLFLAGLAGGASHCVGMCGPFVLSQVSARLEGVPARQMTEFSRLSGAALTPYHLGRMTTYGALGLVAASASGGVMALSGLRLLAAGLLIVAALFFLCYAARGFGLTLPALTAPGAGGVGRVLDRITRPLFARPVGFRGYGLGVALGFLPCGLVYAALAAAASTGDALAGLFAMTAFALGTVPALIVMGLAGHLAAGRWRQIMAKVGPVLLTLSGLFLLVMAWRLATA